MSVRGIRPLHMPVIWLPHQLGRASGANACAPMAFSSDGTGYCPKCCTPALLRPSKAARNISTELPTDLELAGGFKGHGLRPRTRDCAAYEGLIGARKMFIPPTIRRRDGVASTSDHGQASSFYNTETQSCGWPRRRSISSHYTFRSYGIRRGPSSARPFVLGRHALCGIGDPTYQRVRAAAACCIMRCP